MDQFDKDMDTARTTTDQLQKDIENIQKENREIIAQIKADAKLEIDEINAKNEANQAHV